MRNHPQGFTLIEAMITLLVLSIGLLGLGTLQARLTASSAELHSGNDAYRLASAWLERFSYLAAVNNPSAINTRPEQITQRAARFETRPSLSFTPALSTGSIIVAWNTRAGRQSIRLQRSACTKTPQSDKLWLLPHSTD
jgi:prepilin-type N-terminal cleavage/methylation domain-containing protein